MATEQQKRDLINVTRNYNNALSNGDAKAVKVLAKELKKLKDKSK